MAGYSERAMTTPRPTGIVTFLFTDIEGSTGRWEEQSAEMGAARRLRLGCWGMPGGRETVVACRLNRPKMLHVTTRVQ